MDDESLLRDLILLAKASGYKPLGLAQKTTAENLYQEILRRMAYKVDPGEVTVKVANIRYAERRIGEISSGIAGDRRVAQEYDNLVRESGRLEREIDALVHGEINVGGN